MIRLLSEVIDALGICFVLDRHGWSDLHISCSGEIVHFRISGVFSDAVGELAALCQGVLRNEAVTIFLYDEPGGYALSVAPDARQQHTILLSAFELREYNDASELRGDEKQVFSIRVKREQLLGLLMGELWKVRRFMSEPSYQKYRPDGFPNDILRSLNEEWDAEPTIGPSFLK